MISIAKMSKGLYIMDNIYAKHSSLICNTSTSSLVCHYRLGHISNVGLHAICTYHPYISNKNAWSPCDACHYANEKKLSFSFTYHTPFELLHGDLWGPFYTTSILGHKYFLTLVNDFSMFT